MKHILRIVAYGVGGLLVAIGLTFGAFALAGKDISNPAGPVEINRHGEVVPAEVVPAEDADHERRSPKPERSNDQSPGAEPTEQPSGNEGGDDHGGEDRESPTPTPKPTDDGEEDSGSDDSGSDDSGSDDSGSDDEPEGGGEDD